MSTIRNAFALHVRDATPSDLASIREIYNQGIADRIATLDEDPQTEATMREWFAAHGDRYAVLVGERDGCIVGWVSLNPYSHRCAYRGVADLSVYIERTARGRGIGDDPTRIRGTTQLEVIHADDDHRCFDRRAPDGGRLQFWRR